MKFILNALVVMFISTCLWGCSSVKHTSNSGQPVTKNSEGWVGYVQTGKASFYAHKHQAKRTASGELFDFKKNTAAHRKLPFGTKVRVTNMENGKSVVVKINDRGPFVKDRILDLSQSAFSSIASTSSGIIKVKIEVVE